MSEKDDRAHTSTAESAPTPAPRLFISYRWSSPQHEEWVLSLGTNLRSHGIDVILDKWHLQEGQDAFAFMERMATDPKVSKVLLICDRGYVERADKREGGVGVEAQIVSPNVYEKSDQTKFAAAVVEFDTDGRPLLPAYMRSRIYFDLATEEAFSENYEKIVRWAFGKPFYAVPPVGRPPEFLDETHEANLIATSSVFSLRASKTAGGARLQTAAAAVLSSISGAVSKLRLELAGDLEGDQRVVDAIQGNLPLREQALEAMDNLIASEAPDLVDQVHAFLESFLVASNWTPLNKSYSYFDNDVIKFFSNSFLLGFVALCMRHRKYGKAAEVLAMPFFKPNPHDMTGKPATYGELGSYLKSMEHRKDRLKLNRISVYADVMNDISKTSLVKFIEILEADFTLYLRSLLSEAAGVERFRWHPATLVFATDLHGSFPTYVRASSRSFYERLRPLLLGLEAPKVREVLEPYSDGRKEGLRFAYWDVNIAGLANSAQLGTIP